MGVLQEGVRLLSDHKTGFTKGLVRFIGQQDIEGLLRCSLCSGLEGCCRMVCSRSVLAVHIGVSRYALGHQGVGHSRRRVLSEHRLDSGLRRRSACCER